LTVLKIRIVIVFVILFYQVLCCRQQNRQ